MKKIFTLLFASVLVTSAFAQYDARENKDFDHRKDVAINNGDFKYGKNDDKHNDRYYFTAREKDMQIAQINREYEYKIQAVKSKFFMSWMQKKRQVEFLKDQREKEICKVMDKFNDRRNMINDNGRDKKRNW